MKKTMLAALAAILAAAPAAGETMGPLADAAAEYARHAGGAARCTDGEAIALAVGNEAEGAPEVAFDAERGRLRILYRMVFKQITEGWNWHPEADPAREDYYRFDYLPLASVPEDRGAYRHEDKIGVAEDVRVQWRYDYFFAFDNLYDFYERRADDDAGFAAEVDATPAQAERLARGDLRMALRGRLGARCTDESTTFYKATYGHAVDFTLKKRYLLGTLDEVTFYDAADGRVLARLTRRR